MNRSFNTTPKRLTCRGSSILDKIAIFNRVEQSGGFTTLELAVAMARILGQIENHEGRVAFLSQFLLKVAHKLQKAADVESAMEALSSMFRIEFGHGDDASDEK